jgi:hypothetical protein
VWDEKEYTGKIITEICETRQGEKMVEKFILFFAGGFCRMLISRRKRKTEGIQS